MKDTFFAALALSVLGSTATAACHDFKTDQVSKAQEVIICYNTKCDLTRMEVQCNGGGNNFTAYEVGWSFGYKYNVHTDDGIMEEYILWKGDAIPSEEWDKIRVFKLKNDVAIEVEQAK